VNSNQFEKPVETKSGIKVRTLNEAILNQQTLIYLLREVEG
jgi:hypothetical protein